MTIYEAIQAIISWLTTTGVGGIVAQAKAASGQFEITIRQVYPEQKLLTYRVVEESRDCWRVEAA